MKCLRCNELLNDGVISCSKCGFMFDTTRVGNELSKSEYQQLGVIDTFNILVQAGVVLTRGKDEEITNSNNLYSNYISSCNYSINATFIGIRKIEDKNKFIKYRKDMGTYGIDLIDKIKSFKNKEVSSSYYPIFRYEVNGVIYVSEGFYPIDGDCPYVMGNDYSININPNLPNMFIYNNLYSNSSILNDGVITEKYTLFVIGRLILCGILLIFCIGTFFGNIGNYLSNDVMTKNYIDAEATLSNKECESDDKCIGEYDFYVKGILYTYKTDEAQKRLDDTIEIRCSPSDPYKCVMKNSNVGGNLGAVIFNFIFSGLMLFFVIFHVNLFKKCIK